MLQTIQNANEHNSSGFFTPVELPWAKRLVWVTANVQNTLMRRLPQELHYHLPSSISVCADERIPANRVAGFLEEMGVWLHTEYRRRESRRARFVTMGLFTQEAIHTALTPAHIQPWLIYHSPSGGLEGERILQNHTSGVVPCSSMTNHGVAWSGSEARGIRVWLVTDRRRGEAWDWDADIGHESAHAAFAPVPLFAQSLHYDLNDIFFTSVMDVDDLDEGHLVKMCYLFTELAVVAVRGETRPTKTGLPVPEPAELVALLSLAKEILPGLGFDRAYTAYCRASGRIDAQDGTEIFEIGAAALRALARINRFVCEARLAPVAGHIFEREFPKLMKEQPVFLSHCDSIAK